MSGFQTIFLSLAQLLVPSINPAKGCSSWICAGAGHWGWSCVQRCAGRVRARLRPRWDSSLRLLVCVCVGGWVDGWWVGVVCVCTRVCVRVCVRVRACACACSNSIQDRGAGVGFVLGRGTGGGAVCSVVLAVSVLVCGPAGTRACVLFCI